MCAQVNFDIAVLILFKHVKDHHPQNLFLLLHGCCCCVGFFVLFLVFVLFVVLLFVFGGWG